MAESVVPWALICRKGWVHIDSEPASVFLRSNPHGAYTTTRTLNEGMQLLLWERHMRRLGQSMDVLAVAMPDRFPHPRKSFNGLLDIVNPPLQEGLHRALTLRSSGEELNITVLASPNGQLDTNVGDRSWDVSFHLSTYTPKPASIAAHVAVMGPGRDIPLAKYSLWASAREKFENAKPSGATEIVLSKDGDLLLEGSVTNFFVVAMNPNVEVQTAAVGDGILPGVIRQLVIEVCERDGIPVRQRMPSWESRGTWIESFLTSSLRIVQPVGTIKRPDAWTLENHLEVMNNCKWTEVRFDRVGRVTEHIRNRVLQRALDESLPIHAFLEQALHID